MLRPKRTRRSQVTRWVAIAAAALVVAAIALSGYLLWPSSSSPSPGLTLKLAGAEPGDKFGISDIYRPNPAPHSFGAIPLCVSGPGSITITSLVPQGGNGGLKVVDFATRKTVKTFGASQRTLAQEGFPASHVVDVPCGGAGTPAELGLSVQRTVSGNGRFESLKVNYDSAGKHLSMSIPFSLKLCGPDGKTNDTCGQPDAP